MTDPAEAREALAAIRQARESVPGEIINYPLWYDLLYGVICATLIGAQGLPQPWSILALVSSLGGLFWMIHWFRRRYGWWVSGYSPKRARWVAFAMVAVFLALIAVTFAGREFEVWWVSLATAPAAFVVAIVGSRLWMRVWRRELAEAAR